MRDARAIPMALFVSTAMALTSIGAALGQEESPAPEASAAPEVSPAAEMAEPSTLSIDQISQDRLASEPMAGKQYKKAIAKASPDAVSYLISTAGVDNTDRVIELSRMARAIDEAGDAKAAKALIGIATLLYRNEWSKTKIDNVTLNTAIETAIAVGDYPDEDPALALTSLGNDVEGLEGLMDICFWPDGRESMNGPDDPSGCADNKGRQVRVDFSLVDEPENGTKDLYTGDPKTADVGGVGIHKVVQDKTANDKLAGKKYKKALAKAMKKAGPEVARYRAAGSGMGPEQGVIDMVLLAREADEVGNAKAAKAFMALALAAYRSGVTEPEATAEHNAAINALIEANQAGVAGLQLYPPDGMTDVCTGPDGEPMWEGGGGIDSNTPWECEIRGGTVSRVPFEEPSDE
jgi:hypothetical protein